MLMLHVYTSPQLDLQTLIWIRVDILDWNRAKGYIMTRDSIGCRNQREALRRLVKKCLTFIQIRQPSIVILKAQDPTGPITPSRTPLYHPFPLIPPPVPPLDLRVSFRAVFQAPNLSVLPVTPQFVSPIVPHTASALSRA
jgi:hypothetical protein